jgi:leader peptidase (prepilin peptidase)/N-methyltransferase
MNSIINLAAVPAVFDRELWSEVPFGFWILVFFVFGCIVGSFLNVCIHRMPLDQSLISPPSHCPHCQYSIPWYLNVPLVTWLWLKGRCANCKAPISPRYFGVELLTGVAFCATWMKWGHSSAGVALALCLLLSGFIVATFIDFEHFIIPDEITLGGIGAGCVVSMWVPQLHGETKLSMGLLQSLLGAGVGWGITYAVLRLGKLLFGKQKIKLDPDTEVTFTEGGVKIGEEETPYEEIFYRPSDEIRLKAKRVRAMGRTWENVEVRLSQSRLLIGQEAFDPEKVTEVTVITDSLELPREAMGFGDVKFLGAIGAFLGWKGAVFALMASSVVGALIGLLLIAFRKHEWSSKIPYGPYIALAATVWIFAGPELLQWWARHLAP